MHWRLSTIVLLAFVASAHAASLTESAAIAIAKAHCAKQIPRRSDIKWTATPVYGTWEVSANREKLWAGDKQPGSENWEFNIPVNGPLPKQCDHSFVRYDLH
jgi:hypothetical protein